MVVEVKLLMCFFLENLRSLSRRFSLPSVGICPAPSINKPSVQSATLRFIRFDAAIVILTAANSISAVTESLGGVGMELGSVRFFFFSLKPKTCFPPIFLELLRTLSLLTSFASLQAPDDAIVSTYTGITVGLAHWHPARSARCTRASQGVAHCSYWSLHEPYRPAVLNFSCRKDETNEIH